MNAFKKKMFSLSCKFRLTENFAQIIENTMHIFKEQQKSLATNILFYYVCVCGVCMHVRMCILLRVCSCMGEHTCGSQG